MAGSAPRIDNIETKVLELGDFTTKYLGASLSVSSPGYAELTDLAFTGLELGATYEFHFNYYVVASSASASHIVVSMGVIDNTIIQTPTIHVGSAGQYETGSISHRFIADSTAHLKFFLATSIGNASVVDASSSNGVNIPNVTGGSTQSPSTFATMWKVKEAP